MTPLDKLKQARIQLILDQPFFASIALRLTYAESSNTPTALTNGLEILYNPAYFMDLSKREITAVLGHLVLHIISLHHTRRGKRDQQLWNIATDYAINPLLRNAGFQLPSDALIDDEFEGMHAERIYEILANKTNNDDESVSDQNDAGGMGDVVDLPASENIQEQEARVGQSLVQAALFSKQYGQTPSFIERMITEITTPKIPWRQTLHRFFTELTRNDFTWQKPSSRYLHAGLYLPSLLAPQLGTIILIIDTSGSIDQKEIDAMAAEVQEIVAVCQATLIVIYVDSKVQSIQLLEHDDTVALKPVGGGGTDYKPGFHYIDEHQLEPIAVIYLTDGICRSFPVEPCYPVLWAQFGWYPFKPPFGEVIFIDED